MEINIEAPIRLMEWQTGYMGKLFEMTLKLTALGHGNAYPSLTSSEKHKKKPIT